MPLPLNGEGFENDVQNQLEGMLEASDIFSDWIGDALTDHDAEFYQKLKTFLGSIAYLRYQIKIARQLHKPTAELVKRRDGMELQVGKLVAEKAIDYFQREARRRVE